MTIADAEKVVRRGAEFLDARPDANGWVALLDLDSLDMSTGTKCILGQLYATPGETPSENWYRALSQVGLTNKTACDYGFISNVPRPALFTPSYDYGQFTSGELNQAWTNFIKERRNPSSSLTTVLVTEAEAAAGFAKPLTVFTLTVTDPSGTPDVFRASFDASKAKIAEMADQLARGWKVEIS